jgi:hypothetical protein
MPPRKKSYFWICSGLDTLRPQKPQMRLAISSVEPSRKITSSVGPTYINNCCRGRKPLLRHSPCGIQSACVATTRPGNRIGEVVASAVRLSPDSSRLPMPVIQIQRYTAENHVLSQRVSLGMPHPTRDSETAT